MRICIYGAGASGAHIAVRLADAGHEVSVVARGAHLEAIRQRGLSLRSGEDELTAQVRVTDRPADLGPQDVVVVTVKATALREVAAGIRPLIGPATQLVFAQNGMPWWYAHGLPADRPPPPEVPIFALAPAFLEQAPAEHVLGAIIYTANAVVAPGVVLNTSPGQNRLDVAPITGAASSEVLAFRAALIASGLQSLPVPDIREAVWRKLLINMTGSTIALATGNRSSISRTDPALGEVYRRAVAEALAIAASHGYPLDDTTDVAALQAGLNDHKPSLLQDYEAARPMEIAEIVLAPMLFARSRGVPTPTLDTLAAIVRRLAIDRSLYAEG